MKRLLLAAAFVLASVPAFAIDLTQQIKDVDGTIVGDQFSPNKQGTCADSTGKMTEDCLTVGKAVVHALLFSYQDEAQLSGEEKFKRGELARRIMNADHVVFTAEDTATIKKLVGKLYGPWVIVQVYGALDPATLPPK